VTSIQFYNETGPKLHFAQFSAPQAQMSGKSLSFSAIAKVARIWYQIVAKSSSYRMIPLEAGLQAAEWMKTSLEEKSNGKRQISSLFRPHVRKLAVTRSKMAQFRCGFQFQV
jgi:hypothetical protein